MRHMAWQIAVSKVWKCPLCLTVTTATRPREEGSPGLTALLSRLRATLTPPTLAGVTVAPRCAGG